MSNPRSSRRTSARVATFHVDDEIEISSSLLRSDSLGDRVSGAGPPALSLQGNADLLNSVFKVLRIFGWTEDTLLKKIVGRFRC